MKTDVLIVGGGLAGLAAAMTLQGRRDYLLAEKEPGFGGLASSVKKNGFTFDYSGHLLHLRWKETSGLILRLLKGNHRRIRRNAWVRLAGTEVPFPFQANLYGLPGKVRSDCVKGFLDACLTAGSGPAARPEAFREWSLRTFGAGISGHFMWPYNAKLWRYPLDRLTTEWCAPFVPMPSPDEIIRGAYLKRRTALGYNTFFHYPAAGGIQALPDAMAKGLKGARTGCELLSVDLKTRTAFFKGLGEVRYRRLINTMPLKDFVALTRSAPAGLKERALKLRHNSVHVLNLGVHGTDSDRHWTYFPEKDFLFYRAGVASNFSRALAPAGHASLYIETSTAGRFLDRKNAEEKILRGLVKGGVIRGRKDITERLWLSIPCAYVIYDADRAKNLPLILSTLNKAGVFSIGRYGAWKYSFMEESVKEGLETARAMLRHTRIPQLKSV